MNLLGAVGNAVDDGGGALFEFAGDAVDALVQHFVDAIGEIDELVMDVPGLEIEAGGEALAGVEHRARGLGAGFLETIEQVAAALAEREDHVVAGVAERAGDVGAALFKRAGDALGDLIDAGGDRIGNQRDVMAQIDLHAGNGAANLFGLADQIVALMGDVLQQRADAHLVVAVGAFERRDFVGNQRFEFAGARDGAFDAVAHGRDFAADRLTDGNHRVARGAFRLRKADRNLRHRLRDHPQFLAAPGKAREEIKQQDRRKEQRGETGEHQRAAAALADRGLHRGKEADGQKPGAENPDSGKKRGERIDVAGGTALLNGLQDLTDCFAVVIGGAAGRTRLLDGFERLPVGAAPKVESTFVVSAKWKADCPWSDRCGPNPGRHGPTPLGLRRRGIADVQGFLNGRKRHFGRVFGLLGIVRHVQSDPSFCFLRTSESLCANVPSRRSSKAALLAALVSNPQPSAGLSAPSRNILLARRCERNGDD